MLLVEAPIPKVIIIEGMSSTGTLKSVRTNHHMERSSNPKPTPRPSPLRFLMRTLFSSRHSVRFRPPPCGSGVGAGKEDKKDANDNDFVLLDGPVLDKAADISHGFVSGVSFQGRSPWS